MKTRATLVLVLVLSLALVPVLASVPAHAATQYNERLNVYTAGQSAFWSITLNKLGTTLPALTTAESASGLTGYRLVAMSSQDATASLQIFGVDGYNLLGLPSTPSEGLFLTVNATSASSQSSVVSAIGNGFATEFTLVSSAGDSSLYFAPVDFANVAAPILYSLVPTLDGGFTGFATETTLLGLPEPYIELTAAYNGTGFAHTISVGADATNIIGATGTINLSELIGSTNATITTSLVSNSSVVAIHSLDGIIVSSDPTTTVLNHLGNFSGSYYLTRGPGDEMDVNATIQSQPPAAVAYRVVDRGALSEGQFLGVTVVVANTGESGSLYNVTLNDNWWQNYPTDFQLSSGNDSFTIPIIATGHNVTEAYVLKVISSSASQVTIPTAEVTYLYQAAQSYFKGQVELGQQLLQLNGVGPSLGASAEPSISSGSPLGTAGNYTVTITNTGNSPAFNVAIGDHTLSNPIAAGGSATIEIPIQLSSLIQRNFTTAFSVVYTNTAGQSLNVTTNSVQLLLSHSGMVLPFIQVTTSFSLTSAVLAAKTMNVTYSFTNSGKGTPDGITATESLPSGVTCTLPSKEIGSCSGSTFNMNVTTLTTQSDVLNLTFAHDNYIVQPTIITTRYDGITLHTFGGSYVIPAGIVLTKTFNPDVAFPGMNSVVTLQVSNVGSLPIFNATLGSTLDSFDQASASGSTLEQTFPLVAPGLSSSLNYTVVVTDAATGSVAPNAVSVSFLFAGASQGLSLTSTDVIVYKPVTAAVVSSPTTPEENHDFTIQVTITNSAPVDVSNVVYTLKLPSGVTVLSGATVSNGVVTLTLPSLQASSNQTLSLSLRTDMGLTIDTTASHLSYQYQGSTLTGQLVASKVIVNVDSTTRYTIPIIAAVLIALAAVVYVRRKVGPVANP